MLIKIIGYAVIVITFGFIVRSLINHLSYVMHISLKNKIRRLEANSIHLNARLRRKIKKKVHSIRTRYSGVIFPGSRVEAVVCEMYNNAFNSSKDFQNYFSNISEMNSLLKTKKTNAGQMESAESIPSDLFINAGEQDTNLDLSILASIQEIINHRKNLYAKIQHFNKRFARTSDVHPFIQVELLNFDSIKKLDAFLKGLSYSIDQEAAEQPEQIAANQ